MVHESRVNFTATTCCSRRRTLENIVRVLDGKKLICKLETEAYSHSEDGGLPCLWHRREAY